MNCQICHSIRVDGRTTRENRDDGDAHDEILISLPLPANIFLYSWNCLVSSKEHRLFGGDSTEVLNGNWAKPVTVPGRARSV